MQIFCSMHTEFWAMLRMLASMLTKYWFRAAIRYRDDLAGNESGLRYVRGAIAYLRDQLNHSARIFQEQYYHHRYLCAQELRVPHIRTNYGRPSPSKLRHCAVYVSVLKVYQFLL